MMSIFKILAETEKIPSGQIKNLPTADSVDILSAVLNGTYMVAAAFAVIIIILAGYTFATGSYDSTKITKAKNAILYAVVGLIIIISAFVLTQFILGKF